MMMLGAVGESVPTVPRVGWQSWPPQQSDSREPALWRKPWGVATLDLADTFANDASSGSWIAFSGSPIMDLPKDAAVPLRSRAQMLLRALDSRGLAALSGVDGGFAIAWWNGRKRRLSFIRDRFGIEPCYYALASGTLWFGSRGSDVAGACGTRSRISMQGLAEFLTYCYLPGRNTLMHDVLRVEPGDALEWDADERVARNVSWYRLSYESPLEGSEHDIAVNYRNVLERSVLRRLDGSRPGALLSGGMDSSSVVTFARRHLTGEINTYGFRCSGASFDESHYARTLAVELGVRHTEVEYSERRALDTALAAAAMEDPFCDVGIEIGTWMLAEAAHGRVDYLLTGDGGDELWASHPVYAAQRIMRWYDALPLPKTLRRTLSGMTSLVTDSDSKRGLAVVMKRILPPIGAPRDLGHFRWRLYQTPATLSNLVHAAVGTQIAETDPFLPVHRSLRGYRGPNDGLSRWLYSDYRTVSGFYFSRLLLARRFGLEVRVPFYDRELVELGARIPARLKLEGIERTKRLFRVAMEGVLPDIVNHRKDKLGHSVPLKNWLRAGGALDLDVRRVILSESFLDRRLIRAEAVKAMLDEHERRRHNHSHRLWALYVLELWMRAHLDNSVTTASELRWAN